MPRSESKYLPLLNVQHMPSSVGKKEKYSMQGSVSPSQLQSMTMSEQEGDVCVIVFRLIVDRISFKYITKAHSLRKILLQYQRKQIFSDHSKQKE